MTKEKINKMFYDNCKEYNLCSLQLRYDKNTKNYVLDEKSHKEDEMIFKQSGLDNLVSQLLALIEQEKKEAIKDILTRLNIVIEVETRPYIEAGTVNYDKPIRESCVERSKLDNKIENLAKECGVEL